MFSDSLQVSIPNTKYLRFWSRCRLELNLATGAPWWLNCRSFHRCHQRVQCQPAVIPKSLPVWSKHCQRSRMPPQCCQPHKHETQNLLITTIYQGQINEGAQEYMPPKPIVIFSSVKMNFCAGHPSRGPPPVNLPNRYSRRAEGLWRMRRHGPVIAQCTDLVVFPHPLRRLQCLDACAFGARPLPPFHSSGSDPDIN